MISQASPFAGLTVTRIMLPSSEERLSKGVVRSKFKIGGVLSRGMLGIDQPRQF